MLRIDMSSESIENRVVIEVLNNEEWHTLKVGFYLFFLENQYIVLLFPIKRHSLKVGDTPTTPKSLLWCRFGKRHLF